MHAWDRYKPWNATVNHKIKAEWELKKKTLNLNLNQCVHYTKEQAWQGLRSSDFYRFLGIQLSFPLLKTRWNTFCSVLQPVGSALRGVCTSLINSHTSITHTLTSWKWIIPTAINKSNNQKRHIVFSMYMKRINQTCGAAAPHEGEQTGQ